jgi:hypothetical protein
MKMENIIRKTPQQPHQLQRVFRIIHAILIRPPEPGQINGLARYALLSKELPDSHEVGLHASVGRRIRA